MYRKFELIIIVSLTACFGLNAFAAGTPEANLADLEDLTLADESYWNGSDLSGGFSSGGAYFDNNYNTDYGSWDGWGYSNLTDTTASGWSAQYNAIPGTGQSGSNYGIAFVGFNGPPTMTLNQSRQLDGIYVTNTNYAYYSMLNGDGFAKQFGGDTGNDEDWFLLTITGKDNSGEVVGTEDFYLADYRFADNSRDYIVDTWQYVDLSSLGSVKTVEFTLSSSDVGDYGMNTPAYFAMDTVVPEPVSLVLFGLGGIAWMSRRK